MADDKVRHPFEDSVEVVRASQAKHIVLTDHKKEFTKSLEEDLNQKRKALAIARAKNQNLENSCKAYITHMDKMEQNQVSLLERIASLEKQLKARERVERLLEEEKATSLHNIKAAVAELNRWKGKAAEYFRDLEQEKKVME